MQLERGKADAEVSLARESVQEDVKTVAALHLEIEQLKGENADLGWALRQQQVF